MFYSTVTYNNYDNCFECIEVILKVSYKQSPLLVIVDKTDYPCRN